MTGGSYGTGSIGEGGRWDPVRFVKEKEQLEAWGYSQVKGIYEPEYLNAFFLPEEEGKGVLFMGLGKKMPNGQVQRRSWVQPAVRK